MRSFDWYSCRFRNRRGAEDASGEGCEGRGDEDVRAEADGVGDVDGHTQRGRTPHRAAEGMGECTPCTRTCDPDRAVQSPSPRYTQPPQTNTNTHRSWGAGADKVLVRADASHATQRGPARHG